jgi:hypothetical protein
MKIAFVTPTLNLHRGERGGIGGFERVDWMREFHRARGEAVRRDDR